MKVIPFPKKNTKEPTNEVPLGEVEMRTRKLLEAQEELYHKVNHLNNLVNQILRCLKKDKN